MLDPRNLIMEEQLAGVNSELTLPVHGGLLIHKQKPRQGCSARPVALCLTATSLLSGTLDTLYRGSQSEQASFQREKEDLRGGEAAAPDDCNDVRKSRHLQLFTSVPYDGWLYLITRGHQDLELAQPLLRSKPKALASDVEEDVCVGMLVYTSTRADSFG